VTPLLQAAATSGGRLGWAPLAIGRRSWPRARERDRSVGFKILFLTLPALAPALQVMPDTQGKEGAPLKDVTLVEVRRSEHAAARSSLQGFAIGRCGIVWPSARPLHRCGGGAGRHSASSSRISTAPHTLDKQKSTPNVNAYSKHPNHSHPKKSPKAITHPKPNYNQPPPALRRSAPAARSTQSASLAAAARARCCGRT
jgi:hypothetical protein